MPRSRMQEPKASDSLHMEFQIRRREILPELSTEIWDNIADLLVANIKFCGVYGIEAGDGSSDRRHYWKR